MTVFVSDSDMIVARLSSWLPDFIAHPNKILEYWSIYVTEIWNTFN
jgi:hypothetical protein